MPCGMRFDFLRSRRKLVGAAGETHLLALRVLVDDRHMRIGDGGLLQIDVNRMRPLLIVALHLHLDSRPVRAVPFQPFLPVDVRLVLGGVDRHIDFRRKLIALDAADDVQRLADGELPVHSRSRDPHPLLAARLAELVEFRAVEELAENACDLALYNPRAVVFHDDARLSVAIAHLHTDLGKYPRFLAGIERIVHRLFDGGDQCLGGRIEAEQMTVLEKELRNGNFPLPARHFDGGGGCGLPVRRKVHCSSSMEQFFYIRWFPWRRLTKVNPPVRCCAEMHVRNTARATVIDPVGRTGLSATSAASMVLTASCKRAPFGPITKRLKPVLPTRVPNRIASTAQA